MDQMDPSAQALLDAVEAALPGWVETSVTRHLGAGGAEAAREAGERARRDLLPRLRHLLAADVDAQRTTPLAILRDAMRYPTEVLRGAGVAPARRDDWERERFPDDDYGLTPVAFADFGPEVAEAGLRWGAGTAWAHKERHR